MGAKKRLTRLEAVEQYIVLRLRTEEINRLDYLLHALKDKSLSPPSDSPFSAFDLADTVRTALFGWVASLTDKQRKAVYAFDPLLKLFPHRKPEIIKAQIELEACHSALQEFRNNVAFHARSEIAAHFKARKGLRDVDTFLDLVSAIHDFRDLMARMVGEEAQFVPELPGELMRLSVGNHPAFRKPSKSSV
jgi:hypothetical protein